MILSLLRLAPILAVLLGLLLHPARAQSAADTASPRAPANKLTAAEAQQALDVLQDPQKREQLIAVLKAIAAAAPTASPRPAPAGVTLRPHSLGAELLVVLSHWSARITAETLATAHTMTGLSDIGDWLGSLAGDPQAASSALVSIAWVLLIVAGSLLFELIAWWVLRHLRAMMVGRLPGGNGDNVRLLRLLPLALVGLLIDLVPVAVFAATGNLLSGIVGLREQPRLVVLAMVNAYALCRAVMCVARMVVAPDDRRRRLWRLDDEAARFVVSWLRRITVIAVFGQALIETALLLGLDPVAHDGIGRLLSLAVAALLIFVVVRSRRGVAAYLRAPRHADAPVARWRALLAEAWPYLAVITIVTGWVGLIAEGRSGFAALYFPGVTLAVLIAARLATIAGIGTLDRLLRVEPPAAGNPSGFAQRLTRYRRPLHAVTIAVVAILAVVVLLQLWGMPSFEWFSTRRLGRQLVSASITIAVAVLAAVLAWEAAQAVLERRLALLGDDVTRSRAARLATLMPMLRTALLATILIVVGLTALSEIGVNIAPLLAGAGIAGIAIGFGAQRLVQDVITGIFVLVENAIQIGDWVTAAGLSGSVEQLSVRTIRLRAGDGAMHIIPFSSVTTISNSNRGRGNATVAATVAFHEDTDRVVEAIRAIVDEMRADEEFGPRIIDDFALWGVDAVRPWGVTILGQIPCVDTGRWPVQREFNRRMKKRFAELEIEIAGSPEAVVRS